jgi:predicted dehydrogenase
VRVGIVGYGVCRFGAQFGFQDHPNVEVAAVSDLFPDRCAALARACRCEKTYPSLEEMVKDRSLEAIFLATDAPSHARHAILCLNSGKHVACAVPAVWGSLDDADELYETVKKSGLTYMMFETSAYRPDCHAMRQAYRAGAFGKLIYSEGQYYHYFAKPLGSYKDWRRGLPPMWYPTHSTAYFVAVTGKSFTAVSCQGFRGDIPTFQPEANPYKNPFDSEIALLRTSEGGASRMSVCWGTRGSHGEYGHVRGERGMMESTRYEPAADLKKFKVNFAKPQLPPKMPAGGHGGSHGYLTEEFVTALLLNRKPMIDVAWSLNMTVPGIVAHQSALKDGELMKVPQYDAV